MVSDDTALDAAGTDAVDAIDARGADASVIEYDEQGREVLSWATFGEASRRLARDVLDAGYEPEVVIAIARGGLLLAGAIAYALDVKACGALNVEFYTGMEETLPAPVVLPPFLDGRALAGKRVLLVDDVSDSGRTLDLVAKLLEDDVHAEIKTVCLYTKPRTIRVPDFYWRATGNWIAFPWSAQQPVKATAIELAIAADAAAEGAAPGEPAPAAAPGAADPTASNG